MLLLQVLSPRRQLDKFSPQQLAAIAWSYAMVNYDAPQLFEAVQEEAMRKPPLAEMLSKAGLLRGSSAIGVAGAGARPNTAAGSSSVPSGLGGNTPGAAQMQGTGAGMVNSVAGMNYSANHGAGPTPMQQRAQQSAQQAYASQPSTNKGVSAAYSQVPAQQGVAPQPHKVLPTGYGNPGGGNGSAPDAAKGSEVARAAEEHKKEMEEKQRQVIGCEEGGELCPLCVEEMDATDMALMPCPCGYQVCLLCLNKIRNEGNKQCPACRSEYVPESLTAAVAPAPVVRVLWAARPRRLEPWFTGAPAAPRLV